MNFTPSAKALVYRELQFIASSGPLPVRVPPISQIFDEVAQDIRLLFLEAPKWEEALIKL
jgi:hypothetical protein